MVSVITTEYWVYDVQGMDGYCSTLGVAVPVCFRLRTGIDKIVQ